MRLRQVTHSQDVQTHYKLYKAGKHLVNGLIVGFAIGGGLLVGQTVVQADTTSQPASAQTVSPQNDSSESSSSVVSTSQKATTVNDDANTDTKTTASDQETTAGSTQAAEDSQGTVTDKAPISNNNTQTQSTSLANPSETQLSTAKQQASQAYDQTGQAQEIDAVSATQPTSASTDPASQLSTIKTSDGEIDEDSLSLPTATTATPLTTTTDTDADGNTVTQHAVTDEADVNLVPANADEVKPVSTNTYTFENSDGSPVVSYYVTWLDTVNGQMYTKYSDIPEDDANSSSSIIAYDNYYDTPVLKITGYTADQITNVGPLYDGSKTGTTDMLGGDTVQSVVLNNAVLNLTQKSSASPVTQTDNYGVLYSDTFRSSSTSSVGYTIDKITDTTADTDYQNLSQVPQNGDDYIIYVTPRQITGDFTSEWTITYSGAGDKTPADVTIPVSGTMSIDAATGETDTDYTTTSIPHIDVPYIPGYSVMGSTDYDSLSDTDKAIYDAVLGTKYSHDNQGVQEFYADMYNDVLSLINTGNINSATNTDITAGNVGKSGTAIPVVTTMLQLAPLTVKTQEQSTELAQLYLNDGLITQDEYDNYISTGDLSTIAALPDVQAKMTALSTAIKDDTATPDQLTVYSDMSSETIPMIFTDLLGGLLSVVTSFGGNVSAMVNNVNGNSTDKTLEFGSFNLLNITYAPDPQTIDISYIDQFGDVVATDTANGKTDQPVTYTVNVPDGDTLVSTDIPTTYDNNDGVNQTGVVHVTSPVVNLTVNYVDQSNGNRVVNTDTVDGKTGQSDNYVVNIPTDYDLVSSDVPSTFGTTDETGTVVLSHQTTTTPLAVTKTVHYTGAGDQTPADNVVTLMYNDTHDLVTNADAYQLTAVTENGVATTPQDKLDVVSPALSGYSVDKGAIDWSVVQNPTSVPTNGTATVSYTPEKQTLTITYVTPSDPSDPNSPVVPVKTVTITGKTGTPVNYTPEIPSGYEVTKTDVPTVFEPGNGTATIVLQKVNVPTGADQTPTPVPSTTEPTTETNQTDTPTAMVTPADETAKTDQPIDSDTAENTPAAQVSKTGNDGNQLSTTEAGDTLSNQKANSAQFGQKASEGRSFGSVTRKSTVILDQKSADNNSSAQLPQTDESTHSNILAVLGLSLLGLTGLGSIDRRNKKNRN